MKLITKSIITHVVSLFSIMNISSQGIVGTWQGTLNVQGVSLEIVFHIEKQDSVYISLMDSPSQGAFAIPTTKTTFKNGQLEVVVANLAIFYQGKFKNDTIVGTFNQGGIPMPLTLVRTEKKEIQRPQEPQLPYPYDVEEVKFQNAKEKILLAGTLTLPKQKTIAPAVILIAGSGPNDRDETVFNHKPFWILADYLTRQGIAVLRYDKRGVDESGGEYFTATTQDFAEDAKAAFEYLKTKKEIDPSNIGLIGHSEGGVIAPMIAAENSDVKFIILMAGLGVTGTELVLAQHQHAFDKTSLTNEGKDSLNKALKKVYSSVKNWKEYVGTNEERNQLKEELTNMWQKLPEEMRGSVSQEVYINKTVDNISSPWFRHFLKTNPIEYLNKLSIPVLAINGENDTQVEFQSNLNKIEAALKVGKNNQYQIKSYPGLNHLFQESITGDIDEYGKIEQTISPAVLSDITTWIKMQINK